MKLHPLIYALGLAGLLPFLAAPLWRSMAPLTVPPWLDQVWLGYAAMIASFMAGTFWGLALIVSEGPAGLLGMLMSAVLMALAWASTLLPFPLALLALGGVFVLLVFAELWRERTLDPLGGYLRLRLMLTVGVLVAFTWRWLLGGPL